ncbi:hypothetical protein PLESTB_000575600 [Pleodorina starrii]|uniref:Uncharacterized protein n=1 Tax=Pleodorina starrii TaxID=330485 RepID=A0A9W6BHA5_9CHLO|nr:hypothetical protein PLESTB_000575600 [Pleodorina starrii]GLC72179.1 hypothetical protein PLESTF_001215500 [Pleodorina starrii]
MTRLRERRRWCVRSATRHRLGGDRLPPPPREGKNERAFISPWPAAAPKLTRRGGGGGMTRNDAKGRMLHAACYAVQCNAPSGAHHQPAGPTGSPLHAPPPPRFLSE